MSILRLILLIAASVAITIIVQQLFAKSKVDMAVAVFTQADVAGEITFRDERGGCRLAANFTKLPAGLHGFHIHKAGDLRGEGCAGACEHYHKGRPQMHGGAPGTKGERHTGDLGNVRGPTFRKTYFLAGVRCSDLWGRSLIVHADEDDLGRGGHEDSATTGHSGARIACALIGRVMCGALKSKTRKVPRK